MIPSSCSLWISYLNNLAKENIWHLWSFWLSLKMKTVYCFSIKRVPCNFRRMMETQGNENKLLLSYHAPHEPISRNSPARWPRDVLNGAGVDTKQFGAHSTRAASTSAALSCGVQVDILHRAAGWSSESTFTRFYRKEPAVNTGQALMELILSSQKLEFCNDVL